MSLTTPPLDTAVVFMTNKTDRCVLDRVREIRTQLSDTIKCYVLLDASIPYIERSWISYCQEYSLGDVQLVPFNIAEIASELSVKLFAPGRLVPGSCHLPLLWLSLKLKHKWFWFLEDDVVYTGKWSGLIDDVAGDKSDLLCSHIASYRDIPNWSWWATLKAPAAAVQNSNPLTIVTKAFFPVYRVSARALLKVLDYQRSGWAGHMEVLVPTILKYVGYTIRDLNASFPAVVYSSGVIRKGEGYGELSSLRFHPPVADHEIRATTEQRIFHPVKLRELSGLHHDAPHTPKL